jgi:hypothetical protein
VTLHACRSVNGTIRLNETEVAVRERRMSRHAFLLNRRSEMAEEFGEDSDELSLGEVSRLEAEEERKKLQLAEDTADAKANAMEVQRMAEEQEEEEQLTLYKGGVSDSSSDDSSSL